MAESCPHSVPAWPLSPDTPSSRWHGRTGESFTNIFLIVETVFGILLSRGHPQTGRGVLGEKGSRKSSNSHPWNFCCWFICYTHLCRWKWLLQCLLQNQPGQGEAPHYLWSLFALTPPSLQELVGWLGQGTADFTILGGDFNTDPRDNETSYSDLKSLMVSWSDCSTLLFIWPFITGQFYRGVLSRHKVLACAGPSDLR